MKLFLKISAGFLIFFILLLVGLNLYFTNDRLKSMILPEVRSAVGTEVQVEQMSLTFFRTFPQFGVELQNFVLPDPDGETVASLEELLVGVELFPLLSNEISISHLRLNRPVLNYRVYEDSTSNIDFLLDAPQEETDPDAEGYAITIPEFTIQSANVNYRDDTSNMLVTLEDLNANISLQFADLIESTVDATLGSLSASLDGASYVENLSLSLNQESTVDLENEILTVTEGVFSIRGLGLNLAGSVSDWSSDAPVVNLQFNSSSENFGELLRLAPPEYDEQLAGLETRGSLQLDGSVSGSITEDEIPAFDLIVNVSDGYLKNPDLPDAIEDINLSLTANNEIATISEFSARAAENSVTASGTVERPLDDNAVFSIAFDGDVDLATVSRFYPIEEFGVQDLRGLLAADMTANGRIDLPEDATLSGSFTLSDGTLQYAGVPRPIEQINARIQASQDRIQIEESGFRAASNRFSMSGSVADPLDDENRSVDLSATLNFDLASIKEFYPIDEDTLELRGQFDANVVLSGRADPDEIERLLQRSTFELRNGYIDHRLVGKPLEDITLTAEATGTRLSIQNARFVTGENSLAMNGSVSNYLGDDPVFDLNFDGNAVFSDISSYYSLEPWIQELTGTAVMNLRARGPAGDPTQIALNGSLVVSDVNARGDSLGLPVTGLNGTLSVSPDVMTLEEFIMNYGSSDISLNGRVQNYLGFLEESHSSTATMPSITGNYSSNLLDMDEMIDWDEESDPDEPFPIELPAMTSNVSAEIDRLLFFGIPITNISGTGRTTHEQIIMEEATAKLFDGTATGRMVWNIPDPLQTNMSFSGNLDSLSAESFFRDTGFLGEDSRFHQHVTGAFSTNIDYSTDLDRTLTPDVTTTEANGSFGMTRARLRGHPIQEKVADFLKVDEVRSLALDEWTATYTITDAILTFEDFRLTSENIGIELEGTQHMVSDKINYTATLLLPARFKSGIASVISGRAADALQREDGTMAVPVLITGTSSNPQVRPDTELIQQIIRDALREGAGNALKKLFNG
ncbi:AsmA family protein [Rhodohalobacter sp. 8-1]|uniref:AsmA family protein n=1 Tax=Rhodohalobacter sp. 8-1 TaxID=3131972 RepID=UPI0030EEF5B1